MKQFILIVLAIIFSAPAWAESVKLTSGKVIDGKIIERTAEYIKIDTGQQVWNIPFRMMTEEDAEIYRQQQSGGLKKTNIEASKKKPTKIKKVSAVKTAPPQTPAPQDIMALLKEKIAPRDYQFARTGFTEQDYQQAIQNLQEKPESGSRDLISIAKSYYYLGDTDTALKFAQQAILKEPKSVEAMFTLGFLFSIKADYENALQYYKQAVMRAPEYAYGQIGDIYRELGRCSEAMDFYKEFLRLYPEDYPGKFGVYHTMGRCATFLKSYDDAIEYFQKSLEYKPDYTKAYVDLAFGYRLKKDYKKALGAFRKAINLEPDNFYACKGLGDTYITLKQPRKAVAAYKKTLDLHPDMRVITSLVKELAAEGKYVECLKYLDSAQKLQPLNPTIYQGKGRFLIYLGRYDEAKLNYKKALAIYKRKGDFEKVVMLKQTIRSVEEIEKEGW